MIFILLFFTFINFHNVVYLFDLALLFWTITLLQKTNPLINNISKLKKKRDVFISVLIPIFNEEKNLKNLFTYLKLNNLENIKLIFINDYSTDRSLYYLQYYSQEINNVKIVSCPKQKNVGDVLNFGFRYIDPKSDYVGVLNGDCIFSYGFFKKVKERLNNYEIPVLNVANYSQKPIISFVQKLADYDKTVRRMIFSLDSSSLNNGYFIEKKFLKKYKNWSSITEDQSLAIDLKKKIPINILQDPKISIYDKIPDNWSSYYYQIRRWCHGDILTRMSTIPKNPFDVIISIYYFLPILTIYSFLFSYEKFFVFLFSDLFVIFLEALISFKSQKYYFKKIIMCFLFALIKRILIFVYYFNICFNVIFYQTFSISW